MLKKKDSFFIIKALILGAFIFLQIYLIFIKTHFALDIEVYPNTNPTPNICKNTTIGQTFIAKRDNLSRIEVMLGTHGRENDKDVLFKLFELSSQNKLVAQKVFNASEVKNNLFHSIDFNPIQSSKDRKYYFLLHSPSSTQENSICAWMNKKNIYKPGDFLYNNTQARGDLVFRVYSKRPIYKELGRIIRNYQGIFGKKWFLIVTIILFEVIQIIILVKLLDFIWSLLKTKELNQKEASNV